MTCTQADRESRPAAGLSRRSAVAGLGAAGFSALAFRPGRASADDSATVEANKALVIRAFDELVNKGNILIIGELFAPEFINYFLYPKEGEDAEGIANGLPRFKLAFPDLHIEVNDIAGEGDFVLVRGTFTGTHQAVWQGIEPTGKKIEFESFHLVRIAGGKIVEHRGSNDAIGIFRQLGMAVQLVPAE